MTAPLLTIKEASERTGMWPQTLRRMCVRGQFPNARQEQTPLGSYWLIPITDLDRYRPPAPGQRGRPLKKGVLARPKAKRKKGGKP